MDREIGGKWGLIRIDTSYLPQCKALPNPFKGASQAFCFLSRAHAPSRTCSSGRLSHLALHLDIGGCIGPASYTAHTHWSVSFIWTFFSVRSSPLSPQASRGAECLKSARNAPGHQLTWRAVFP